MYTGASSTGGTTCSCEKVVFCLVKRLPRHKNHRLFFDNWFSTIPVMLRLTKEESLAIFTFRTNRIGECPFDTEKNGETREISMIRSVP